MICSTIHGFCQHIIAPYPVASRIDADDGVLDRYQTELVVAKITYS